MIKPAHMKLPLGGPAWLRAMSADKKEMADVLPAETPQRKREEQREILGLRDAADRMEKLEKALQSIADLKHGAHGKCEPHQTLYGPTVREIAEKALC